MNYKAFTLFLGFVFTISLLQAQSPATTTTPDTVAPRYWKHTASLGITYTQNTLTNPPVGYGQNQIGGNSQLDVMLAYARNRWFWINTLQWQFGLVRIGSGPVEPGSDQKIPFQKSLDKLQINTLVGYSWSRDSSISALAGFEIYTQATPSYYDPQGKIYGVFLRDIRESGNNPIQSKFFAPASALSYVGISYSPHPSLFLGYSPLAYKGILVLDDAVASLVGAVDAQGLPTATIHGNPVEIVDGKPVFKKTFNQFGSYFIGTYRNRFWKSRLGFSTNLRLYSNYLKEPQNIDVFSQTMVDMMLFKGLSLSYNFNVYYDHDVLVQITDKDVPGGLSGKFGRRVAMQRQLMLRYQVSF